VRTHRAREEEEGPRRHPRSAGEKEDSGGGRVRVPAGLGLYSPAALEGILGGGSDMVVEASKTPGDGGWAGLATGASRQTSPTP